MQGAHPVNAARLTPERVAWILSLICGVAPLWATQALPLVDLPQHLHLISVLHRLDDASTIFPEIFARRPQLTPYLGYYYTVSALNWLLPLELANRLFLSAYVAGLALSLGFLLSSLKRPTWPALLALPFAYGDSFAWGFINYCAALPLAFLTCGFFVRAIEDTPRRRYWASWLAGALVSVLLFHVQVFAWLAVALPMLLLMTPAEEGPKAWKARVPAVLGVAPGVVLFVLWVGLRVGQPQEIAPGQPWRSWGPMLSEQNLSFKGDPGAGAALGDRVAGVVKQNVSELVSLPPGRSVTEVQFPLLAGMTPDGSDQSAVRLVLLLAAAAVVLALVKGREAKEGPVARWRIVGLAALAFVLFLALPFDIRGYMYYLNTRYAHLVAALLVVAVPPLKPEWSKRAVWAGVLASLVLMLPLWRAFAAFDVESRALAELSKGAAPKSRVMGLIWSTGSAAVTHPVYLHSSCVVARESGGLTNFSFALTPHSPLMYRADPPPTFASEWRPDTMNWQREGQFYDHFVLRGPSPEQVFGPLMQSELYVAARVGDFTLVRRR
jgi:hypothetical protein